MVHGTEEIADLLPIVRIDKDDVLCAFVIKSNRDRSTSTSFRDKIISQVSRCISDSEAKVIFLTSTKPVNQRIIAQLKALCAKSDRDFYYLDRFYLIKIFLKHKLCCEDCGKLSLGKDRCAECESEYQIELKKEQKKAKIDEIKKKINAIKWDKKRGQLPKSKIKELEELKNQLKEV